MDVFLFFSTAIVAIRLRDLQHAVLREVGGNWVIMVAPLSCSQAACCLLRLRGSGPPPCRMRRCMALLEAPFNVFRSCMAGWQAQGFYNQHSILYQSLVVFLDMEDGLQAEHPDSFCSYYHSFHIIFHFLFHLILHCSSFHFVFHYPYKALIVPYITPYYTIVVSIFFSIIPTETERH